MAKVWKCVIKGHHSSGVLVEPGLHYQSDLPSTLASEPTGQQVADALWSHIGSPVQNATCDDITIDELVVTEQVLKPAIGEVATHPVGAPGLLSSGLGQLPKELVPIVHFHTDTHSRSARGWSFFGGPLNSGRLVSGAVWDATMDGALAGLTAALTTTFTIGTLEPTTMRPVVYSRTRHTRGLTPFTFNVRSVTYDPHPTWLRSRETIP